MFARTSAEVLARSLVRRPTAVVARIGLSLTSADADKARSGERARRAEAERATEIFLRLVIKFEKLIDNCYWVAEAFKLASALAESEFKPVNCVSIELRSACRAVFDVSDDEVVRPAGAEVSTTGVLVVSVLGEFACHTKPMTMMAIIIIIQIIFFICFVVNMSVTCLIITHFSEYIPQLSFVCLSELKYYSSK